MRKISAGRDAHPEELEVACLRALSDGRIDDAFRSIDRRCRISPLPRAHHFVLRAETLSQMGDGRGAMADITHALELAPEDIQANRRMLAWGDGEAQRDAAQRLIGLDPDPAVLIDAMNVLRRAGARAIASLRAFDDIIAGWVAWDGDGKVELHISGAQGHTVDILPQDQHPLVRSKFAKVASIELDRPRSQVAQTISLSREGERFYAIRAIGNDPASSAADIDASHVGEVEDHSLYPVGRDSVTIIVPIYRDVEATRICLESLKAAMAKTSNCRAILVDDASPEPQIKAYLARLARRPNVTVLTNATNMGFVGAVNRALRLVSAGDVILLNADTVVPRGFIERLAATARSDPTIATITPLSNNGEFTSFPVPFKPNPMPTARAIAKANAIAARVNDGAAVDIPNGIGFCLYITRRCLDEVGVLSEVFQRGYLEDVDYCLRAREHGLRNLCDPSVFVGHVGSRSFGKEKRALVVQNLEALETKYPDHRGECAAFMAADPLRAAREAIERSLPRAIAFDRLIVSGAGVVQDVVRRRARGLTRKGEAILTMTVQARPAGPDIFLQGANGAAPQSLAFRLAEPGEQRALAHYLRALKFDRIEIADPARVPLNLADLLTGSGRQVDLYVADAGLICPRGTLRQLDGSVCSTMNQSAPCASCAATLPDGASGAHWRAHWRSLALRANRILVPCASAQGFASGLLDRKLTSVRPHGRPRRGKRLFRPDIAGKLLRHRDNGGGTP